uniref:Uncharacterized protein n=1 Tax=Timema poppense TaxID=170557 RepID=A0A7R9H0C3_TIMPO|nr:unnamed protein product [Timema poppensis]
MSNKTLVCLYSWSELAKADDETPTSSLTPPTEGSASAVGLLRGMTVAHNSDALTKGRTQVYPYCPLFVPGEVWVSWA